MKAIRVDRFGGPEVLRLADLPDPEPAPGEALVAVVASDVLFVDTMIRSGAAVDFFPIRPPYVPGNGVGGQVTAVGDGDESLIGRQVVAHTGGRGGGGGYAQTAAVPVSDLVEVPHDVDLLEALALLHDGPTALRILERVDVRSGERVVVLGAAGGMGVLLVQLLRATGAFVVGAARGKAKLEVVEEAGADAVVDYTDRDWANQVLESTGRTPPSVVLDGVGGSLGRDAFDLLPEGGRFSAHGAPSGSFAPIDPDLARLRRVEVINLADLDTAVPSRAKLAERIIAWLALGRVSPLIGQTFPLHRADEAHRTIGTREAIAKTLLVE